MNDRKLKLIEIAGIVGISKERVGNILSEHLNMKKLVSRWVPRLLTADQKRERVTTSEKFLRLMRRDRKNFFRCLVTMDETWIHHYTPESKKQSAQWTESGESRPKRPKTQQSAGKVLGSVFWDSHGILLIDYLEKGKTINSEYYCKLLDQLRAAINDKRLIYNAKKSLSPG